MLLLQAGGLGRRTSVAGWAEGVRQWNGASFPRTSAAGGLARNMEGGEF